VVFDHTGFLEKFLTEQYLKDAELQMENLPIQAHPGQQPVCVGIQ